MSGTTKFLSSYAAKRPVTTGVFAVATLIASGACIAFATGIASPITAFADPIAPVTTVTPIVVTPPIEVPVTPIVPPVPIVVVPPTPVVTTPPPVVTTPTSPPTDTTSNPNDGSDAGETLSPCCTNTTPPSITPPPTTSVDTTPIPTVDTTPGDTLSPCCTVPPPVIPPIVPPVVPPVIPPVVPPPIPQCTLSGSPGSITQGGSSTLSWTTTNGTSFTISSIGAAAAVSGGSEIVSPTTTTTYTGTVTGPGGQANCNTTIVVTTPPPPPPPPVECTISANPTSIAQGGTSTLTWTTSGATTFSIDQHIGTLALNGSTNVSPTQTTTYTGTATGAGGTVNCQTTVTVTTTPPPPPPAPTCTLVANPNTIQIGSSSILTWTTTNATSFTVNHTPETPVAGGSISVSPLLTTTYTGTATGAGGTVNCPATVTVTILPPPPAPTCTLVANPTAIQTGSSSVLSWTTTNANSFIIDQHIGSVTPVSAGSTTVSPVITTTYTGTATGAGGTVNCGATVTVTTTPPPPPQAPTCTLVANPTTIQVLGSSALSWTTTNTTSFVINQHIGSVTPVTGGSTSVSPLLTTTYTGTAAGPGGTVNCSATVTVTILPPPPAPTCTLVANPTAIQTGSSSVLSWTTTNANSFVIDQHIGSVTPVSVGSTTVTPGQTTTYTGIATDASGQTVNCYATVTVTTTPPPPPQQPACTLIANPTSIQIGSSSVLGWTTQNAVSFVIDNHIGSVTPVAGGSTSISPLVTTTYTGIATGSSGETVNCSATVTVTLLPPPPAPTCTLVANPTSILQGQSSTLSWTTTNANSFAIDQHVGSVTPVNAGSTNVSPSDTTTYTGTATGSDGQTVNCQTTVTVTTPGGSITPACTLSINPTSVNQGSSAILSWGGTDIQSVSIDNSIGSEGPAGSVMVSPGNSTTYTGTFLATNGDTLTCQASVTVTPPPPPPPPPPHSGCTSNCGGGGGGQYIFYQYQGSYVPPPQTIPAAYVALSQIPYTGLDLGSVGTVVYWIALILICLSASYLVVFNLIPFIYLKVKGVGLGVSAMLNTPAGLALAHNGAAAAGIGGFNTSTVQPQKSAYAIDEGFRSFAEGKALTIDDIVKGLAREAAVAAPAAAVGSVATHNYAPPAPEYSVASLRPTVAYATAPPSSIGANAMPVTPDVRDFIAALLNGERATVFSALRQVVREGGDAEMFLTQVVCALDDAYRARLEGTGVHPEIARLTEHCATPFLERLTAALTNAVDSSYSPGISGSKLALARALAVIEG